MLPNLRGISLSKICVDAQYRNLQEAKEETIVYPEGVTDCAICLEPLEVQDGPVPTIQVFECGHAFHTFCALQWNVVQKKPCAMCATPVFFVESDLESSPAHFYNGPAPPPTLRAREALREADLAAQQRQTALQAWWQQNDNGSVGVNPPQSLWSVTLLYLQVLTLNDSNEDRVTQTVFGRRRNVVLFWRLFACLGPLVADFLRFWNRTAQLGIISEVAGNIRDVIADIFPYHGFPSNVFLRLIDMFVHEMEFSTIKRFVPNSMYLYKPFHPPYRDTRVPEYMRREITEFSKEMTLWISQQQFTEWLPPPRTWWLVSLKMKGPAIPPAEFKQMLSILAGRNRYMRWTGNGYYMVHPFYGPISRWNTSLITDMSDIKPLNLPHPIQFDISDWDVSHVTNMDNCNLVNDPVQYGDLRKWDVKQVTKIKSLVEESTKEAESTFPRFREDVIDVEKERARLELNKFNYENKMNKHLYGTVEYNRQLSFVEKATRVYNDYENGRDKLLSKEHTQPPGFNNDGTYKPGYRSKRDAGPSRPNLPATVPLPGPQGPGLPGPSAGFLTGNFVESTCAAPTNTAPTPSKTTQEDGAAQTEI